MKKEIEILYAFFEELRTEKILFCVLRNYEEIPEHIGHDVDLLIQREQGKKAEEILVSILMKFNWEYKVVWNKDCFKTLIIYGIEQDIFRQLKLDIWTSLNWRGIPWVDAEYILSCILEYKSFYIPPLGCEAAVSMFKELMGGGDVPVKYMEVITRGILEDKSHFEECIQNNLIKEHILKIEDYIEKQQWDHIAQSAAMLKKGILKKARSKKRLWKHYIFLVSECFRRIISRFQSGGILIAFIGPDGSGKSSVIQKYSNKFKLLYQSQKIYHSRFELLPELRSGLGLSNKRKKNDDTKDNIVNTQKNEAEQSLVSKLVSWVVVIYYTIEFIIGRIVFFRLKRKGRMIIFDRYYYDFFVQPNTRKLIWKSKNILLKLVPHPDLIIHLYADGQTVFQRKGELDVDEINLQNTLFSELLQSNLRYNVLDTGKYSVDEIVEKVAKIMFEKVL